MFWASIWHFDLENRIRGSGEIHHCKYCNINKVSCVNFQISHRDGLALPQPRKTVNLNDEFLPFPWSDFLHQGIKLKVTTFSIQWCRNYFCIYPFYYLIKIAALKNMYFFFPWPLDLRWAALDSNDRVFCSWENKLSNKLWLVTVRVKLRSWEAF